MSHKKLAQKKRALMLAQLLNKSAKNNQLNNINHQKILLSEIEEKNNDLEKEISILKEETSYVKRNLSETGYHLKMEFIADIHKQKNKAVLDIRRENNRLDAYIKNAFDLVSQYDLIKKKLDDCNKSINREIFKKFQKDCT